MMPNVLCNCAYSVQAHFRGHQVRKQYKKLVWSVSILEKVILRWRRKGAGLRGFRAEKAVEEASEDIKSGDEYEFLRIGRKQKRAGVEKALARVKSMAHHPEACEQYMRLVSKFEKVEVILHFHYYFHTISSGVPYSRFLLLHNKKLFCYT